MQSRKRWVKFRCIGTLNKLGVPNLEKRRMQQLSILMYKVKNKLVPDYLYDMFSNVGDVHDHNVHKTVGSRFGIA
jgi:hypothetical protein